MREPLLTIEEVSEYLGLTATTLRQQRSRRTGAGALAFKVGRYLRWRPEDLDEWLEAQREPTASKREEGSRP